MHCVVGQIHHRFPSYVRHRAQRPAKTPAEALYLVMSSSAAWEQSRICDTSSVARSAAGWMYRLVRRTGLPASHFCLSSQDFRVLSKACLDQNCKERLSKCSETDRTNWLTIYLYLYTRKYTYIVYTDIDVCMYIHVCILVYTYMCIHVYVYVYRYLYIYFCIHLCMYVHIHMYICTDIDMCIYINLCLLVHKHICIFMCIYMCIYSYRYMYTFTYIQI